MNEMTPADWLEDFERVKRASLQAQAHAVKELDAALISFEANPAQYNISIKELRRRRANLEALKEQCSSQTPTAVATRNMGQKISEQEKAFQEQDKAIASLKSGVSKLGSVGYQIREETHLQVGLIEELHCDIDGADSSLRRESLYADGLSAYSSDLDLYITIFILVVIIICLLSYGLR
uniref:t-SNARE coiled-coil homology domain-containing protein n=1 Tax=Aureoumbra lagunensis TaxID=44058 RepID=A0A7S3JTX3_9STRA|mmetsp:Transcript_7439/g.11116  ORF Transcript_7439/g.11116 Transcript_7439/m.11116 type:complete len:179 (+) Transcript_7439:113-649(+)